MTFKVFHASGIVDLYLWQPLTKQWVEVSNYSSKWYALPFEYP